MIVNPIDTVTQSWILAMGAQANLPQMSPPPAPKTRPGARVRWERHMPVILPSQGIMYDFYA
jgi:hypothetical protein